MTTLEQGFSSELDPDAPSPAALRCASSLISEHVCFLMRHVHASQVTVAHMVETMSRGLEQIAPDDERVDSAKQGARVGAESAVSGQVELCAQLTAVAERLNNLADAMEQ